MSCCPLNRTLCTATTSRGIFFVFCSLAVHEILAALECEDDSKYVENIIYVEPPIEDAGQVTDEDSDKSDEEH